MKTPSFYSRILALASLAGLFLAAPATHASTNTAIVPEPRDPKWVLRHEGFVEEAKKGGIEVLFLGDSITDFWCNDDRGKEVWDKNFAPLKAANFGISGDRTQHVLWRLEHGEVDGLKPKAVVLMIGTNNTGKERTNNIPRNTTPDVIEGVTAVVKELRARLPQSRILFLAIFPRGDKDSDQRKQVADVNRSLARLDDGRYVNYLDIGSKFLDQDGNIPKDIMPDGLHPSKKGYEIWADAIREPLAALLK